MRHLPKDKTKLSRMGKISQKVQENKRLKAALSGPIRSIESTLIFEIKTFNPFSGLRNTIEIKHEIENGNNRFNVYLNGKNGAINGAVSGLQIGFLAR